MRFRSTMIDGLVSVYDTHTERVVAFNATAGDIWLLCDGESTLEEIIEILALAYGEDRDTIADAVTSVLQHFTDEGLLS